MTRKLLLVCILLASPWTLALPYDHEAAMRNMPCREDFASYNGSPSQIQHDRLHSCIRARINYIDTLPADYFITNRRFRNDVISGLVDEIPLSKVLKRIKLDKVADHIPSQITSWFSDKVKDAFESKSINREITEKLKRDFANISSTFTKFDEIEQISVTDAAKEFSKYNNIVRHYRKLSTTTSLKGAERQAIEEFLNAMESRKYLLVYGLAKRTASELNHQTEDSLRKIIKEIGGNSVSIGEMKSSIEKLYENQEIILKMLQERENGKASIVAYRQTAREIKDYETFGNALVGVVGLFDQEFAQKAHKRITFIFKVSSAINRLHLLKENPELGSVLGPYGAMAMAALSLMNSSDTSSEQFKDITDALTTISKQVYDLHESVIKGFIGTQRILVSLDSRVMSQFVAVLDNQHSLSRGVEQIKKEIEKLRKAGYIRSLETLAAQRRVIKAKTKRIYDACIGKEQDPDKCFEDFKSVFTEFNDVYNANFIGEQNYSDQNKEIGPRFNFHLSKYLKVFSTIKTEIDLIPPKKPLEPFFYQYAKELVIDYVGTLDKETLSASRPYNELSKMLARYDTRQEQFFEKVNAINPETLSWLYREKLRGYLRNVADEMKTIEKKYEFISTSSYQPRLIVKSCDPDSERSISVSADILRETLFDEVFVLDSEERKHLTACFNKPGDNIFNLNLKITLPDLNDPTFKIAPTDYVFTYDFNSPCQRFDSRGRSYPLLQVTAEREQIEYLLQCITEESLPKKRYSAAFRNIQNMKKLEYKKRLMNALVKNEILDNIVFFVKANEFFQKGGVDLPSWVNDETHFLDVNDIRQIMSFKLAKNEFNDQKSIDSFIDSISLLNPKYVRMPNPIYNELLSVRKEYCDSETQKDKYLLQVSKLYRQLNDEPFYRNRDYRALEDIWNKLEGDNSNCLDGYTELLVNFGYPELAGDFDYKYLDDAYQFSLKFKDKPFKNRLLFEYIEYRVKDGLSSYSKSQIRELLEKRHIDEVVRGFLYERTGDTYPPHIFATETGDIFLEYVTSLYKQGLMTPAGIMQQINYIPSFHRYYSTEQNRAYRRRLALALLKYLYDQSLLNEDFVKDIISANVVGNFNHKNIMEEALDVDLHISRKKLSYESDYISSILQIYFVDWMKDWNEYEGTRLNGIWDNIDRIDKLFELILKNKNLLVNAPNYEEVVLVEFIKTIESSPTKLNLKSRYKLIKIKKQFLKDRN